MSGIIDDANGNKLLSRTFYDSGNVDTKFTRVYLIDESGNVITTSDFDNNGSAYTVIGPIFETGSGVIIEAGTSISVAYDSLTNSYTITNTLPATAEIIQDRMSSAFDLGSHNGITITYNDPANSFSFANTDKGSDAVTTHEAALDPHPQYTTTSEVTSAISGKEDFITPGTTSQYWRGDKIWQTLDKNAVGLGNVDNTSDLNKPISTATQTALNLKYNASNPNGYETPAQLNTRDTNNRNRSNHTGTQLSSTISDFNASAIAAPLTGFTPAAGDIVATDTILQAFQKLVGTDNQWIELITTADVTNSSSTTFKFVNELAFSVVAGKKYYLEYTILYRTAATTTGLRLSMDTTNTAVGNISRMDNFIVAADGTAAMYTAAYTSFTDQTVSNGVPAANTDYIANAKGIFKCTASGTVALQFASEVNGSLVTIRSGSIVLAREF